MWGPQKKERIHPQTRFDGETTGAVKVRKKVAIPLWGLCSECGQPDLSGIDYRTVMNPAMGPV